MLSWCLYLVKDIHVRFEFLMAMIEKITVVWDVILFSLLGWHHMSDEPLVPIFMVLFWRWGGRLFTYFGNNLLEHMTSHTRRNLPQKVYYENLFYRHLVKADLSHSIHRTLVHSNYPRLIQLQINLVPLEVGDDSEAGLDGGTFLKFESRRSWGMKVKVKSLCLIKHQHVCRSCSRHF
jgi:hypothetical protein